jgi:hypothetical protein
MTALLARSDFIRTPLLAPAQPEGFKEWHHFVIHGEHCHVLVNVSLAGEERRDGPPQVVPRVIVIVRDNRWAGAVARFDPAELAVSPDLGALSVGGNHMAVTADGYRVVLDLPARGIRGRLDFTSTSRPFVVNNQPVGTGRMSWLFVPRLRADGWMQIGDTEHRFTHELAYHDHNWGHFRWGDDFSWTWGTVVPQRPENPWSLVFLQMTDRRRLRATSQAVYLWHHDEPAAMLLRSAVRTRSHGSLSTPPDCTLPPPMSLLLDGHAPGVPDSMQISAARAGDAVHAEFRPSSYARLAQPSELDLDRCTVLCEASGTARVTGTVAGRPVDFVGTALFEFLHG